MRGIKKIDVSATQPGPLKSYLSLHLLILEKNEKDCLYSRRFLVNSLEVLLAVCYTEDLVCKKQKVKFDTSSDESDWGMFTCIILIVMGSSSKVCKKKG